MGQYLRGYQTIFTCPLINVVLFTVCPLIPAKRLLRYLFPLPQAQVLGLTFYTRLLCFPQVFFVSFAFDLCYMGLLLPRFHTHLLDSKPSISTQVIQSKLKIVKCSPKEFPLLEIPASTFGDLHAPGGPLLFK